MTSLLFSWTSFWGGIGRAFQALFKILPSVGFSLNFIIWVIIWSLIFGWIVVQARATRKAKSEGRLI